MANINQNIDNTNPTLIAVGIVRIMALVATFVPSNLETPLKLQK